MKEIYEKKRIIFFFATNKTTTFLRQYIIKLIIQNHIPNTNKQIRFHQYKIITSLNSMSQPIKITQQSIYHHAATHIHHSFSVQSFQKYFINSKDNFQQLSRIIKQCNIDDIHCRFNVWRLCLGVVNVSSSGEQKRDEIALTRKKYQQKKDEVLKSFGKKSPMKQPVKKNPLQMMSSPKPQENKQIQTDQFLKQQIHKDIERTYQQMKFFQQKSIQKLLNLILFVWCRRNSDVSYKQGMNQLLASVVVSYFKQAEFRHERPQNVDEQLWDEHLFFNSVEFAESDIYSVFEKIVDIQGDMYKTEADLIIKSIVNPNSKNNTPILQRIMRIKDHRLKHMDLELFRILKLQAVQTQSFMLRWIRCMHTRQFDLDNSFVIWDSIFLEFLESQNSRKNKQFEFIDAMCLAMFMYMRSIVFTKETAGEILQVYQKYPALKRGVYLDELITLAWTICEELRIESQNIQASQSNWFQDSSKVKALHFMQKKAQKKIPQPQAKHKQAHKKHQIISKQLKQADHTRKHSQAAKKHSEPLHKNKEHHSESNGNNHQQKSKTEQNSSNEIINEISTQKRKDSAVINQHKSTPVIEKEPTKELTKNTSFEETVIVGTKHAKEEKHQNSPLTPNQHHLPSPFHNRETPVVKVPDNISITLSDFQITELLQNLNESLPKIRDIDAQSLIRRTIKKIQSKVKQAKDKNIQEQKSRKASKQEVRNLSENGDIVREDK